MIFPTPTLELRFWFSFLARFHCTFCRSLHLCLPCFLLNLSFLLSYFHFPRLPSRSLNFLWHPVSSPCHVCCNDLYLFAALNHWRFWGADCPCCYLVPRPHFLHFLYSLKFLLNLLGLNFMSEVFFNVSCWLAPTRWLETIVAGGLPAGRHHLGLGKDPKCQPLQVFPRRLMSFSRKKSIPFPSLAEGGRGRDVLGRRHLGAARGQGWLPSLGGHAHLIPTLVFSLFSRPFSLLGQASLGLTLAGSLSPQQKPPDP